MPRKRKLDKARPRIEISDALWAWFNDQAEAGERNPFEIYFLTDEELQRSWELVREELIEGWAAEHPGTRPKHWWRFDAPRQPLGNFPDFYYDGELPEMRRFISGAGVPAWVVSAYVAAYECGLPRYWAGHEESDPPTFESQAAFLRRHKLLSAAETRRLKADDYDEVEVLGASFETLLHGPYTGPSKEGCARLNAMEERYKERIKAERPNWLLSVAET